LEFYFVRISISVLPEVGFAGAGIFFGRAGGGAFTGTDGGSTGTTGFSLQDVNASIERSSVARKIFFITFALIVVCTS